MQFDRNRRDFITLLGGAAAWPLAAHAQQPGKLPIIGYLGSSTLSAMSQWTASFVQRLRELGWVEGRNILVEFRWKDGSPEATRAFLTEFVRLKVDVIHAPTNADALEAKRATSVIPIVAWAEEPTTTQKAPLLHFAGGHTSRPGVVVRMLYSVPPPVMYSVLRSSPPKAQLVTSSVGTDRQASNLPSGLST